MYLIILELLEKWEDALQVIEGPLGGKHIQLSNPYMGCDVRKPVFGVSHKVRFNQGSPWLKIFCSQHFSQMEKVVAKFT